jgi:hypothetical protein
MAFSAPGTQICFAGTLGRGFKKEGRVAPSLRDRALPGECTDRGPAQQTAPVALYGAAATTVLGHRHRGDGDRSSEAAAYSPRISGHVADESRALERAGHQWRHENPISSGGPRRR